VRQHARALTGWTNSWNDATGEPDRFHFDPKLHDDGVKVIYHHRGRFGWRDSLRLALNHPDHPAYFVSKLWSYFSPARLPKADARAAAALYVSSGRQIRPLVEAMLMHPLIYDGPRLVKPPIVQIAGMLRGIDRYVDTDAWAWESSQAGQMPFYPPNVSGWDATRWLNTDTWLARFNLTNQMIPPTRVLDPAKAKVAADPQAMTRSAIAFWGAPTLSPATHAALQSYARTAIASATADWERQQYPALIVNGLRALVVASPDYHAC
jgi:uncharacterized protein (DUF1800 family)